MPEPSSGTVNAGNVPVWEEVRDYLKRVFNRWHGFSILSHLRKWYHLFNDPTSVLSILNFKQHWKQFVRRRLFRKLREHYPTESGAINGLERLVEWEKRKQEEYEAQLRHKRARWWDIRAFNEKEIAYQLRHTKSGFTRDQLAAEVFASSKHEFTLVMSELVTEKIFKLRIDLISPTTGFDLEKFAKLAEIPNSFFDKWSGETFEVSEKTIVPKYEVQL